MRAGSGATLRACALVPLVLATTCEVPSRANAALVEGPTIEIADGQILLDGERLGAAPGEDPGIDGALSDTLRRRRGAWRLVHAGRPVPGEITVRMPEEATCASAMNVLATAATAGYWRITLDLGGEVYRIPYAVRGPPDPTIRENPPPPVSPRISFSADGSVTIEKKPCGGIYDVVPVHGVLEATESMLPPRGLMTKLLVSCETGVPLRTVLRTFGELVELARRTAAASGSASDHPDPFIEGLPYSFGLGITACDGRKEARLGWEEEPPPVGVPWIDAAAPASIEPIAVPAGFEHDVFADVTRHSAGLSEETVLAALTKIKPLLFGCYAAKVAAKPAQREEVTASLEAGRKGVVVDASAWGGTDAALLECVAAQLANAVVAPAPSKLESASMTLVFGAARKN